MYSAGGACVFQYHLISLIQLWEAKIVININIGLYVTVGVLQSRFNNLNIIPTLPCLKG